MNEFGPMFKPQEWRLEAFRAVEALDERHYTVEALEGTIRGFARHIIDLVDALPLLHDVAHRAWHLMDDSGETESADDNGVTDYLHSGLDHQRLSEALDRLEEAGWNGCGEAKP